MTCDNPQPIGAEVDNLSVLCLYCARCGGRTCDWTIFGGLRLDWSEIGQGLVLNWQICDRFWDRSGICIGLAE